MALNSDIAFKFGCGRYIQERQAIERNLQTELKRFGTKALFICGENGIRVAGEQIRRALDGSEIAYEMKVFHSTPCYENADEFVEYAKENGFDLICGVGGGVVGDTAKLTAARAGMPLVQIPTSSATCVAATPLSVMYDRETHAHIGSLKLMKEADLVIVDLDILVQQPSRLFWAGVMDSMAKMIEINHRVYGRAEEEIPIGLDMAFDMARHIYDFFLRHKEELMDALEHKEVTMLFDKAVFYAIGVTGIVSGISKGSNQCAIAHKFYEETRSFFYEEAEDFVHGELVAMGLLPQLAYNGLEYEPVRQMLVDMGLPTCLSEIHVPVREETLETYVEELCRSSAVRDSGEESKSKVRNALMTIYH